jgi:hypothetical protein
VTIKNSWNATLLQAIPWIAVAVMILLLVFVVVELSILVKPVPIKDKTAQYADIINKQLWIKATQIMMGYVLGVLCVGAGVIFVWNGIEATVQVEASQKDNRLVISTGSVGVVIIIVGALLVSAVLLSSPSRIGPASPTGGPEAGGPAASPVPDVIPFNL